MVVVLLSIIETAVYVVFRSRYLYGGDSAEYSAISYTWSIAHPPGYPLYSFLSNVLRVCFFFLGTSIITNILSIVPTVITSVLIYKIITHFKHNRLVAFSIAFIYAFLFPVWLYAEVPEVFALNTMLIALITYTILKYSETKKNSFLYLTAFLVGLAVTHHQTFVLFIPAWIVLVNKNPLKLYFEQFIGNTISFLLGFSFYLYAPVASYFKPPIDYENPITLNGFIRLITRASYGSFKSFTTVQPDIFNQIFNALSFLVYTLQDFRVIGVILIAIGLFRLKKIDRHFFSFITVALCLQVMFLFYLNFLLTSAFMRAIFERFMIAIYFILIFPLYFGLAFAYDFVVNLLKKAIYHRLLYQIAILACNVFVILLPIIYFSSNLKYMSRLKAVDNFDAFATNILSTPPKNTILYMSSDNGTFTTDYYYYVKKIRNDLKLISLGLISRDYYQKKIKDRFPSLIMPDPNAEYYPAKFVELNAKCGVYMEAPITSGTWVPYGLLWKHYSDIETAQKDTETLIATNVYLWDRVYHIPKIDDVNGALVQLKALQKTYLDKLLGFGKYLIIEKKDIQAIHYLNVLLSYDPTYTEAQQLLVSEYAKMKECSLSKQALQLYFPNSMDDDENTLVSLLKYYYYCDSGNKKVGQILKRYNEIIQKKSTPLNTL